MTDLRTPPAEHTEFDALCRDVEDYETLPGSARRPARGPAAARAPEHDDALDAEILAGLVSP